MRFPLINRVYEYDGVKYIVWQQTLFFKVYCRTLVDENSNVMESMYVTFNWWKFMLKAKFVEQIEILSKNY